MAGILAVMATVGPARGAAWAIAAVWVFNIERAGDLLFAGFRRTQAHLEPGSLSAGFYLVTAIVPLLLVSHALIFGLLLRAAKTRSFSVSSQLRKSNQR